MKQGFHRDWRSPSVRISPCGQAATYFALKRKETGWAVSAFPLERGRTLEVQVQYWDGDKDLSGADWTKYFLSIGFGRFNPDQSPHTFRFNSERGEIGQVTFNLTDSLAKMSDVKNRSLFVHWWPTGEVVCSEMKQNGGMLNHKLSDVPGAHDLIYAVMQMDTPRSSWVRIVSYKVSEPMIKPARLQLEIGIPFLRMILIGEAGAGKTSLARSLCRKKILRGKDDNSTVGVDESTFIIDGDQLEQETSQDGEEMLRRRIASVIKGTATDPEAFLHTAAASSSSASSVSESSHSANSAASNTRSDISSSLASHASGLTDPFSDSAASENELPQSVISDISSRVTSSWFIENASAEIAEGSFQIIRIWDTAGQDSYRLLQHIGFGADRTVYAIVFNASQSVEAETPQSTVRHEGKHRPCTAAVPRQPSLTYIHDYLATIHNMPSSSNVRVYLVGTHIDQRRWFRGAIRDAERDVIMKSLKGKPYCHLLKSDDIVFVNNTRSGSFLLPEHTGIRSLRTKLVEESVNQEAIPLARGLETLALLELSRDPRLSSPWISLGDLLRLARRLGIARRVDEVKPMLGFHHNLGTVLFFPQSVALRDKVIINVPSVMKLAGSLIQPGMKREDFVKDPPSRDDIDLYQQGYITVELALRLWQEHSPEFYRLMLNEEHRHTFLQLMETLCILCDLGEITTAKNGKKKVFLMPAATENESIPELEGGSTSEAILLACDENDHFPHDMFLTIGTKCITRHNQLLVESGTKTSAWRKTALSKFTMRLPWNVSDGEWLLVSYWKCSISLRMESVNEQRVFGSGEGEAALRQVKQWLSDMQAVTSQRLLIEETVACGCGKMSDSVLCTTHGRGQCIDRATCFHTVDVFEPGTTPMCPVLNKEARIPNGGLSFWKRWTQDPSNLVLRREPTPSGSACVGTGGAAISLRNVSPEEYVSAKYCNLNNVDKLVTLTDLTDLGNKMAEYLTVAERRKLAKQLVMAAGEFVNNFESIMTTYIQENRHGLADTNNVAGQLFYIVKKKAISCKELLCILAAFTQEEVVMRVAQIIERAQFIDG
ncbi:uncharacterized protein LOC135820750 [Sycon ciliatum]|uniref:uncharacterized protein LOC135820750 n=1 Tax=Sycon ciliatum TaxID=27933 RepID=UPI0031F6D745